MAVSFKIPASPKRSIFVIDQFLGVDLSNSGTNIEEVRSPNAENMIRNVPGKVRKRMGYDVPLEFSEGDDVNRAKETSDQWIDLPVDGTETDYDIYDDNDAIKKPYSCVEIEAVGIIEFGYVLQDNSKYTVTKTGTEEEPYVETFYDYGENNFASEGGIKQFFFLNTSNDDNDYLRIRNLRVYRGTEYPEHRTSTYDGVIFPESPWKHAPEDKGYVFIKTSATSPIFGHHTLKLGDKEGDFVTNVNRALNTSDSYATFADLIAAQLAETIPVGKKFYISFDYDDAFNTDVYLGRNTVRQTITTLTGTGTFSQEVTGTANGNHIAVSSASVKIKNLLVCYGATDDVTWSPAPEDDNQPFPIEDVYQGTGTTTQITPVISDTYEKASGTGPTFTKNYDLQNSSTSAVGKLTKVEFDIESVTVTEKASGGDVDLPPLSFKIGAITKKTGSADIVYQDLVVKSSTPSGERVTLYIKPEDGYYLASFSFEFEISRVLADKAEISVVIPNLTVEEMTEREDFWNSRYIELIHVGRDLYMHKSGTTKYSKVYNLMNQAHSMSWQFEAQSNATDDETTHKDLFIVDGKTYLQFNSSTEVVKPVYGNGKIPTVTIAKSPSGGGTQYYALNRLQPGFEELFIGNGSATTYSLSFQNLDETVPRVWIRNQNTGAWEEKVYGTHFTVNYKLGHITFTSAPWDASQVGEDNVKIRAFRTLIRYANSINKCSFGTLFGVGGASDRLFLAGNTDNPNYDYFSEMNDPTYFPDTNYGTLGVAASAIKGYARVNNYLATFKDENEPSQSVFIREGDTIVDDNNLVTPSFKLINTLQGNGAISPYTFGYLQTEPLFLTKSGIYAITAQDITGEKYGQSRSFYINGKLLDEDNLSESYAFVYNDQYILSLNSRLYILDGLQATRTDKSEPYATRQYVGFYCTGIPALIMWEYQDALWFGTTKGKVCKFHTDKDSLDSYNDDGKAIYSCWETPDLDGKLFYKNKTFRYFAVRMMSALKTSIRMYSKKLGAWNLIKDDQQTGLIFNFEFIDFARFSFSTDTTEKVAHTKTRVKKVDKARFKVENDALNEPFGLFDLALEYVESGNYKG